MKKERHSSGLRLLNHVIEDKSWEVLVEHNIQDGDFKGQAKEVISYLRDYHGQYSEFPPLDLVCEELDLEFPEKIPQSKSLENFKRHKKTKHVEKIIHAANDEAKKGNPDRAIAVMLEGVSKEDMANPVKSFKETAEERFQQHQEEKLKPLKGVYPPFETYRKNILLWEDSTFNVILGMSHTGKSWLSAYAAVYAAFAQGKEVLLVSLENSLDSMNRRLDSLYFKLPFAEFRAHLLDFRMEDAWKGKLPTLSEEKGDIWVKDTTEVRSIEDIYQIVSVKKPDIVIADGAYKLSSTDYEASSKLLQKFHDYASNTKIPWVATSQLNSSAQTATGGNIGREHARGNRNWYIDPATVLAVTQTPEQKLDNIIECSSIKDRDGGSKEDIPSTFKLRFDMDRMIIDEVEEVLDQEILDLTV